MGIREDKVKGEMRFNFKKGQQQTNIAIFGQKQSNLGF